MSDTELRPRRGHDPPSLHPLSQPTTGTRPHTLPSLQESRVANPKAHLQRIAGMAAQARDRQSHRPRLSEQGKA
jgi:hypothetical protein